MTVQEAMKVIKPQGNTGEDLTAAYRLLAKKYHPDINPDGAGIMETVKDHGGRQYKKIGGTFFHLDTPDELARAIDFLIEARHNGRAPRVRIFQGDLATGREWGEENDVTGYMGRSTGRIKIPLLINNKRSMGGPALLDHCILKMQINGGGRVLWQAPNYDPSTYEALLLDPPAVVDGISYPAEGWKDGEMVARFRTLKQAQRWAAFMRGERGCK